MSRWQLKSGRLDEREHDFSADFHCTNADTGKSVIVTLQQAKGDPASDLVGACRALAQLLDQVSCGERISQPTDDNVGRLN